MKLKSLLIGSAAVFAAASGAQAADAVVMAPAPEPMEYVRVCDVYGAGFFYIPGTETCLKISGYVFYQIGATNDDGLAAGDTPNYHGFNTNGEYNKYLRARINFDARSETEWGTLQAYIRIQPQDVNTNADFTAVTDQAWLSLGGLRMGYTESAFTDTPINGPAGYGTHSWYGLDYGYSQRQLVQYNFKGGNGLFATISLENDPGTENYMPDVVGNIGVTQGWGTVWGTVGFDEEVSPTEDSEWAASAGIHLNIPGMTGDSLRVIGYYSSDDNAYWNYGDWGVLGSYYHQFTPTFGASVGGQYIANTNYDAAGDPNLWLAELNLVWTPVVDFEVRSEITYAKETDLDGSVSGFVRFTRYFGG